MSTLLLIVPIVCLLNLPQPLMLLQLCYQMLWQTQTRRLLFYSLISAFYMEKPKTSHLELKKAFVLSFLIPPLLLFLLLNPQSSSSSTSSSPLPGPFSHPLPLPSSSSSSSSSSGAMWPGIKTETGLPEAPSVGQPGFLSFSSAYTSTQSGQLHYSYPSQGKPRSHPPPPFSFSFSSM